MKVYEILFEKKVKEELKEFEKLLNIENNPHAIINFFVLVNYDSEQVEEFVKRIDEALIKSTKRNRLDSFCGRFQK